MAGLYNCERVSRSAWGMVVLSREDDLYFSHSSVKLAATWNMFSFKSRTRVNTSASDRRSVIDKNGCAPEGSVDLAANNSLVCMSSASAARMRWSCFLEVS
jgi:hypothetical protein